MSQKPSLTPPKGEGCTNGILELSHWSQSRRLAPATSVKFPSNRGVPGGWGVQIGEQSGARRVGV